MPGIETVGSPGSPRLPTELRPEELSAQPLNEGVTPAQPTPAAPSTTEPGVTPADPATVAAARGRALAGEQQLRERVEQHPTSTSTPATPRPARGLQRPEGPAAPQSPTTTAPADLEQRVERLEEAGRRRAFAESPEAAAAHARDVAAVLPHVDAETRRALQRPLDEHAEGAARSGNPRDVATATALAPALGIRGVDAFSSVLQSQPSAAAREGAVSVLHNVARTNADPLVRRHAEGGILNDRPTVEAALRGTHPSISRDAIAAMAVPRPERVNQLVGVAEQLGPDVARDLAERGLQRTQLPELGGVLGGVVDGVDGLLAPITRPVETATGIARLGAALVTDPVGTGQQIANGVVEAVTEDPARAITGAVVGLAGGAGLGAAGRAATAGRAAGRAGRHADDLPPSSLDPPTTFQHGNIRGNNPREFEQALEANGFQRVLGGDMQNVYERNGEYVKVARSSSDEVRQRRPDIAGQRDAENRGGTTEQEFVFARLRQEFPGLVPETRRIGPSAIVQQRAQGASIRDLPMDVRETAMRNAGTLRLEAERRVGRMLDPNIFNFTFDQTGRVVNWFDPM